MARKYEIISKLAEETAKEVVKNETAWKRYLTTAARIYKYPFQEQLLIYAQRPDATACASIEVWNSRKLNCWVNKGAKGIALIDEENSYTRKLYDEFGQLHYCVDETLRRRLETKLITKILKFKPVPYGTDQSEESSN